MTAGRRSTLPLWAQGVAAHEARARGRNVEAGSPPEGLCLFPDGWWRRNHHKLPAGKHHVHHNGVWYSANPATTATETK